VLAECVLPHVLTMARTFNSRITLLKVLQQEASFEQIDPVFWHIAKTEAQAYLAQWAVKLQTLGISVETQVLDGQPAERVLEFAQLNDVDLILLSSHGQSGLSEWNVSSVVQKIIMRAKSSIMIIRAYQPLHSQWEALVYHRFLLPLDCSARAECVLPAAIMLARSHHVPVLLAHVVQPFELLCQDRVSSEELEVISRMNERNRLEAEQYFQQIIARYEADFKPNVLVNSSVGAALHDLVEQEKVDLVILSAHGRSGNVRWPYGGVVVNFIAYGHTPLLIVQDLPVDRGPISLVDVSMQVQKGH